MGWEPTICGSYIHLVIDFLVPLGDLEPNWSLDLALDDRSAFFHLARGIDIRGFELHEIASARLAVDGRIEERNVPMIFSDFQTHADRPDMFRHQRTLLSDDATLVPCGAASTIGG